MGFFGKLKEKIFGKTNKQSEKYVAALGKSRSNFADKLNALAARYRSIDEDYFDELEEILIEADIGVKIVMEIIEETKKEVRLSKISSPKQINETLVDKMFVYYAKGGEDMDNEIKYNEAGLTVILVVGVNGVGKTTSIAKIAQLLGMSETYFRKLFYKTLQKTPHDYINRLRLCYAEELLRSGYYNVSEVANMSGFLDPNYFSTAMKKATGIPPSKMINKL